MASSSGSSVGSLTNYCAYQDPSSGRERIGHLDQAQNTIQPLSFASGTPLSNLYEVIAVGENGIFASAEKPVPRSSVKLLAPINGRDVLCVGKNYSAHATEFNKSGYDSSDKVDQPTHPVIFTKRFTSIIADGDEIYPHPDFTKTLDYEGEFGVIIGKPGLQISEANALDYVWGYTIINDVTARERQRDHKQFYIGKSPDTFCPMGPIAVPKEKLDKTFRVQTHVNGQSRQDATTEDLIFSVPFLIKTLSEGQTLMPGDVLATGTPAGVGFGQNPPVYLQPGDEVSISVTGLGKLTNRIASHSSPNPVLQQVQNASPFHPSSKTTASSNLTLINNKPLHVTRTGSQNPNAPHILFVHGLGGTSTYFHPLIHSLNLSATHTLHIYDLEGHGLSPTSPLSKISIDSLAQDLAGVYSSNIPAGSDVTLIAHSMGCLIALKFLQNNPGKVSKLILLGPPPSPLPAAASTATHSRAALVREERNMNCIVDAVVSAGTSSKTQAENPLATTAVKLSLLGQDPEGYAKACDALADSCDEKLDVGKVDCEGGVLIVTGEEDKVGSRGVCEGYLEELRGKGKKGELVVLEGVGHWHVFEDLKGVGEAVGGFL